MKVSLFPVNIGDCAASTNVASTIKYWRIRSLPVFFLLNCVIFVCESWFEWNDVKRLILPKFYLRTVCIFYAPRIHCYGRRCPQGVGHQHPPHASSSPHDVVSSDPLCWGSRPGLDIPLLHAPLSYTASTTAHPSPLGRIVSVCALPRKGWTGAPTTPSCSSSSPRPPRTRPTQRMATALFRSKKIVKLLCFAGYSICKMISWISYILSGWPPHCSVSI